MNLEHPMKADFQEDEQDMRLLHTAQFDSLYPLPRNYGSSLREPTGVLSSNRIETDVLMSSDLIEEASQKTFKLFKTRKKESEHSMDQLAGPSRVNPDLHS